jgi:hypothetical protein
VVFFGSAVVSVLVVACEGGPGSLPPVDTSQQQQGQGQDTNVVTVEPGQRQGSGSTTTQNPSGSSSTSTGSTTSSTGGSGSGSSAKPLTAADYTVTCSQPSDCTTVFVGAPCQTCKCQNGAIATSDRADYDRDVAERTKECPAVGDVAYTPCPNAIATCSGNRCQVVIGATASGS